MAYSNSQNSISIWVLLHRWMLLSSKPVGQGGDAGVIGRPKWTNSWWGGRAVMWPEVGGVWEPQRVGEARVVCEGELCSLGNKSIYKQQRMNKLLTQHSACTCTIVTSMSAYFSANVCKIDRQKCTVVIGYFHIRQVTIGLHVSFPTVKPCWCCCLSYSTETWK